MTTLTRQQAVKREKEYIEDGTRYKITVNIRHDDRCHNGHNTFSITADQYRKAKNGRWVEDSFGCLHDTIVKLWPDLAPYIKWHLTSTDGPMHYLANTLYHAKCGDYAAARDSAVWQDAPDFALMAPNVLAVRLPYLLQDFRKAVESLGLTY